MEAVRVPLQPPITREHDHRETLARRFLFLIRSWNGTRCR